jgi:natural product precursor
MKPKNLHTKLSFKKLTISNLCPDEMGHLRGGQHTYTCTIEICTLTWYVSCRPKNC